MTDKDTPTGLGKLREPFRPEQVGKLPRVTCPACRDEKRAKVCQQHSKSKCNVCGNYVTGAHIHLDYVGHAALTDRLLDVDPEWSWEPVAFAPDGLPAFDRTGGLWIRLTVCGVTRLGYGDAQGKTGGDAVKEAIGDALRNAAMRFGAALDLWHKGDLHAADSAEPERAEPQQPRPARQRQARQQRPTPAQVEPSPADQIRTSIRELAVSRGWDLVKVAGAFESDHDESLKTCQDLETLTLFLDQLEAESQMEQAGNGSKDAA